LKNIEGGWDISEEKIDKMEAIEEEYLKIRRNIVEERTKSVLGASILLSVIYDGSAGKACLKLYNLDDNKIYFWFDNTNHRPYLLSDLLPEEIVKKYPQILMHKGFNYMELVEKYDALRDKKIIMTKIIANDPLSIGGSKNSIRNILPVSWESKIKYHLCYIYDKKLIPGMLYIVKNNRVYQVNIEAPKEIKDRLKNIYGENLEEELVEWIKLFHAPIPSLKRVAVDIEVFSPVRNRIPNAEEAQYSIIAISFSGSDGLRKVLLLERNGVKNEVKHREFDIEYFKDERKMLLKAFQIIMSYPIVITFNGDNFDLPYLYHRAQKLGIRKEDIPIILGREYAHVVPGIHIDLYKFFNNKAIQVYAFSNKYREIKTLDSISLALLNESKVPISKPISELSPIELASYCFQDADLTLKLTQFDNELVMKLIVVLMRIAKLPMEDITRHSISNWVKSLAYYEHRKRGFLIPNSNDILSMKGKIYTKAVIKGKKYMGAIVLDPIPGIFFDVVVVDFASLYPSMMKEWNLSYETVRCPHKECRNNIVPGTPHWVCRKRRGLLSTIIGYIRDLRVFVYKPLAKDKSVDENTRRLYDVMQKALKVFINASYGVFGSENFSLYCPPVAESITALGRYAIIKTIERAQAMNLAILYGDTDSLFVWRPNSENINELLAWSKKELHIDLDIDKVYKFVAFSGLKKNYLGVLRSGRIDIKGMVGKKRNTPEFIKSLFKEVSNILASVDNINDIDSAIDRIRKLTKKSYIMLKNKKYPLNELAFRVTLTKSLKEYTKTTPQHVKAAFQLKRYGLNIDIGDIISFVKIRGGDGVKALQLARIDEIDEKKYLEYIETTFRQILESIGVDFDDILGTKHLDKYF